MSFFDRLDLLGKAIALLGLFIAMFEWSHSNVIVLSVFPMSLGVVVMFGGVVISFASTLFRVLLLVFVSIFMGFLH